MEYIKDMKKISGDSVVVENISSQHPTICKTIGGATYVARIHFCSKSKMKIEDKLLRLLCEESDWIDG